VAKVKNIAQHAQSSIRKVLVIVHLGDVMRREPLKKTCGIGQMKFFVARLDANKKTVCRGMCEAVCIENRMMRLWQPVKRKHAEHSGE
jgi:hypothetical protein